MDGCCNARKATELSKIQWPEHRCETCDEWAVALPGIGVGVCGHVDELIDPEELDLYPADVAGYVTIACEWCDRWSPRND